MISKVRWAFCLFLLFTNMLFAQENQNLSEGRVFEGEPTLAVNPRNPEHLIVAWMGFDRIGKLAIHTRISTDAGCTWQPSQMLNHQLPGFTSADPTMVFDQEGKAYLAYIDYNRNSSEGGVYIRKSREKGKGWSPAQEVVNINDDPGQEPVDRPWLAIDHSGTTSLPSLYMTTMNSRSADPPFHPYFYYSADTGQNWSNWQYLDTSPWVAGSLIEKPMPSPAVASDGTFHAAYPSFKPGQRKGVWYVMATSNDRGQNFKYQPLFRARHALAADLPKKAYLLKADPSDSQHLVFLYLAKPFGDADVFVRESFDKGKTWSERIRVNDDPKANDKMQDLVWAAFNLEGDLFVAWRDRRNAMDSGYQTSSAIYGAFRHTDSTNFHKNVKLSSKLVSYDTILAQKGNDFMDVTLVGDTVHAVWGDPRDGALNIWYQRYNVKTDKPTNVEELAGESGERLKVYPNPATDYVTIALKKPGTHPKEVQLVNNEGQVIRSKKGRGEVIQLSVKGLPAGQYELFAETGQRIYNRTVVVE